MSRPEKLPTTPVPGEHYWLSAEQIKARWPSLDASYSSCLWCGAVRPRDVTKMGPCRGRLSVGLRGGG